jgi:hypothetical protein
MKVEYKTFINGSSGGVEGLVVASAASDVPGVVGGAHTLVGSVVLVLEIYFVGAGSEATVSREEKSLLSASHNQQLGSQHISSVFGAGCAASIGDWVLAAIKFARVGKEVPVGVDIAAAGRDTCGFAGGVGNGAAGHTGIGVVVPDGVNRAFATEAILSKAGRSGEALAGNLGSVQQVDVDRICDELALLVCSIPNMVGEAGAGDVSSSGELAVGVREDVAEAAVSLGPVGEGTFGTDAGEGSCVPNVALRALASRGTQSEPSGAHDCRAVYADFAGTDDETSWTSA